MGRAYADRVAIRAFFGSYEKEHSTEPIEGWRAWRLVRSKGGVLRIAPSTPRSNWDPGVPIHATCTAAHTREYMIYNPELAKFHRSPEPGCTCGIHAMKDPHRLRRASRSAGVVGTIAMWGRVIEHTKGWRAEFAYPARLRLVCSWCLWRGELPGVPARVLDRGGELIPVCDRHADQPSAAGTALEVHAVENAMLDTYAVELLPVELVTPGA